MLPRILFFYQPTGDSIPCLFLLNTDVAITYVLNDRLQPMPAVGSLSLSPSRLKPFLLYRWISFRIYWWL